MKTYTVKAGNLLLGVRLPRKRAIDLMFAASVGAGDAIAACPHFIMVADHYREDGTCRCDDKGHTEMAEWEYVWNETTQKWEAPEDDA